jgi:UDP-N-acetylmuramyl pentapeptide phosphotransferase/UDP-N-acetylglucosamine-1-phosphate transferase
MMAACCITKLNCCWPCPSLRCSCWFPAFARESLRRSIPGPLGAILDIGFTIFWVTGITAAFSILDHMDGLCAGVAGVAAGFFTIAAVQTGQVLVATLGAATLGAALGFLRWNFNPAKIFMGDGGAMFLGYLMATLSLKIRPEETPSVAKWLVPVLILGVPIFDTVLVSISRARRGLIPVHFPRERSHRASSIEYRPRPSRRRPGDVCAGNSFRPGRTLGPEIASA